MTTAVKVPTSPNVHPRTHATRTTTPETSPARSAPSVAQVLADQKADQVIDRDDNIRKSQAVVRSPAAPLPAVSETQLPTPAGPISEEAFERNLAQWGSGGATPLTFNGLDGRFQTTGGEEVNVEDAVFVAHIDEARKEWIRFNGEGNQPTLIGIGIHEDAMLPGRDELGDLDETQWELDKFRGEPVDPWQQQIRVPIASAGAGGEIYELTSRSLTSLFAIRGLIDRYGRHPQRRKGLLPLIQLRVGSYYNNKLGADKPKPVYQIVGWVQKDGSAPATKPDLISSGPNDSIPF